MQALRVGGHGGHLLRRVVPGVRRCCRRWWWRGRVAFGGALFAHDSQPDGADAYASARCTQLEHCTVSIASP